MKSVKISLYIFVAVLLLSNCKKENVEPVKSDAKQITSLYFLSANNSVLKADVIASIDEPSKTITAQVPSETDIRALLPTVTISTHASVSPVGIQSFIDNVIYNVTAQDGSLVTYSVILNVEPSSAKQITSFVFLQTDNPIDVDVVTTIDEEAKTITAAMPPGTDITNIIPTIGISEGASIIPAGAIDFTNAIEYTITAEDSSSVTYTCNVESPLSQREILQAILDANSTNTIPWDLANTEDLDDLSGVKTDLDGNIIRLGLDGHFLTTFPKEIGLLSHLTYLYIAHSSIQEIPSEIGDLINLTELILLKNEITSLPPEIGQLTNLIQMNLGFNQINEVPAEIGKLSKLTVLILRSNNLSSLPSEIGDLSKLTILSLSGNELDFLPVEIGKLANLDELILSFNTLKALPDEIGNLVNLTILDAFANELRVVPAEIGKLTKLKVLKLNINKLVELPPEIGFLINLETLNLEANQIARFPQSILYLKEYTLPNLDLKKDDEVVTYEYKFPEALVSIYAANPGNTLGWGVDNYPDVSFGTNGKPTVITMNNKNLTRIPENIGLLNQGLETLNLNGNNLQDLPPEMGLLSTLNVLTLSNTGISTLPSTFSLLSNLALLQIQNNPITSIPQSVCDLKIANGGILTILTDPGVVCE